MIELRPITDENRAAVLALRVSPAQEQFVSGVAESLEEAAREPGGRAVYRAVYAGEEPVGFVMWSEDVDGPPYIAHFLWKLLIDERHQGHGYGRQTLDAVADRIRSRGARELWLTADEGEGSPIPFYERYGFERTGELVFDGEMLFRLDL